MYNIIVLLLKIPRTTVDLANISAVANKSAWTRCSYGHCKVYRTIMFNRPRIGLESILFTRGPSFGDSASDVAQLIGREGFSCRSHVQIQLA